MYVYVEVQALTVVWDMYGHLVFGFLGPFSVDRLRSLVCLLLVRLISRTRRTLGTNFTLEGLGPITPLGTKYGHAFSY